MPHNAFILAHDLGTTGDKATLFHPDGRVAASIFSAYPTAYPQPGWVEQDPAHWRKALFETTRALLLSANASADDIAVISFSGHMNGALLVDEEGAPLRPAIIWADQRATSQADFIRERCGSERVYQLTGNRVSTAYTAAKLLWVKEHQPHLYQQTRYVLQAKDYAAFLFSGVFATDFSDASMTLLLDLAAREWSGELLEQLELRSDILPTIHPSAAVIGGVSEEAARETGLKVGTPVVIGAGDGACATVGAGAVSPGDVYNYIGSSSWVALTTREPVLDPAQRTFNILHPEPDLNIALGAMQAAGGAFDWFERLCRDEDNHAPHYETLNKAAAQVPAGSRGLLFLPYLLGERSPHWNPQARGAFVGLSMTHGRPEMARAVLEGVSFNLRHILDILRGQGATVEAMRLIGGGGQSALWRQILADIYALPILRLELASEATALGAAIIGGVGVGLLPGYAVAHKIIPIIERIEPDETATAHYASIYPIFKQTYRALEPVFPQLARLTKP